MRPNWKLAPQPPTGIEVLLGLLIIVVFVIFMLVGLATIL